MLYSSKPSGLNAIPMRIPCTIRISREPRFTKESTISTTKAYMRIWDYGDTYVMTFHFEHNGRKAYPSFLGPNNDAYFHLEARFHNRTITYDATDRIPRLHKMDYYFDPPNNANIDNFLSTWIHEESRAVITLLSVSISKTETTSYVNEHATLLKFTQRVLTYLHRQADVIKRRFHHVNNNPEYDVCRRRLHREFGELCNRL